MNTMPRGQIGAEDFESAQIDLAAEVTDRWMGYLPERLEDTE